MCIFHKWEYEVTPHFHRAIPIGSKIDLTSIHQERYGRAIRMCCKCFKKQKTKTGAGIWNFKIKNYVHGWEPAKLTKDELRDLKLKKLISNK